jgi:hypothetical protein
LISFFSSFLTSCHVCLDFCTCSAWLLVFCHVGNAIFDCSVPNV